MECASAASNIVSLLREYDRAFSVRRAPYLISYATYVASTILARIAAKRGRGSEEYSSLKTCLAVFRENQETNWAVRRANLVVRNLMKRLGVPVDGTADDSQIHASGETITTTPTTTTSPGLAQRAGVRGIRRLESDSRLAGSPGESWLNIDEIIQSFVREAGEQYSQQNPASQPVFPVLPQEDSVLQGGGGGVPLQTMQSLQPNPMLTTPSRPRDPHSMGQNYYYPHVVAWQHPAADVAMGSDPVDDLLFGFNGSALDSVPAMDWRPL